MGYRPRFNEIESQQAGVLFTRYEGYGAYFIYFLAFMSPPQPNGDQDKKIAGFNLAIKWKKRLHGCAPKEGWFILTNLTDLNEAINAYTKRFDIEEMCARF